MPGSLALEVTRCFLPGFRDGLKMVSDSLGFVLGCPKLTLAIGATMISLLKVFLDPSLRTSPGPSGAVWWVPNDRSLAPLVNNGGGGDDGNNGGDDGRDWDFDGDGGDYSGGDDDGCDWDLDGGGELW